MLCERCQQNTARFQVVIETEEGKVVKHLCPVCAFNLPTYFAPQQKAVRNDKQCPVCGLSLREFRKRGRLGCSNCYTFFDVDVAEVLMRVQGTDHHVTLSVASESAVVSTPNVEPEIDLELKALTEKLAKAVADEDYLLAASLRDLIREREG